MVEIDYPVVIVGAGPAGSTLAVLLATHYGIKSLVICRYEGTANTPRAHIFNQRAMEVLRDLNLEETVQPLASDSSDMAHTSWLYSLAGEEYARCRSWGNDPARRGLYESCSPCSMSDLPQSHLEPVLVKEGSKQGVEFRFGTEFVGFKQSSDVVHTQIRDRKTGQITEIVSHYLIGADGARSEVLEQLGIPVDGRQLNDAFNVHIRADLSRYFKYRKGSLNWILNPEAPEWSAVGNFRMVRPWTEFVVSMHPANKEGKPFTPGEQEIKARLYQMLGDNSIDINILSFSRWTINDQLARSWQKDRVLCIGDATHRHPPINGLGSNTCMSDAFNLAWKLAFVLKGWAGAPLLETLTPERKPVGQGVVKRANEGMEVHRQLWKMMGSTQSDREAVLRTLEAPTEEGEDLRIRFRSIIDRFDDEVQAIGIQMNQVYTDSTVTLVEPGEHQPDFSRLDPLKEVFISTFPGYHLPHVWLTRTSHSPRISTLDLAGHGYFTLFTGVGGKPWLDAMQHIASNDGIPLRGLSVGFGCEYMDIYRDWSRIRGVGEDGIVLVRPDHFVAWRSNGIRDGHLNKLRAVLRSCLSTT